MITVIKNRLDIQQQESLLRCSINNGIELSDVLRERGYTYEDLTYRNNPPFPESPSEYHTPADYAYPAHEIPAVSFFSGAGGLDLGFKYAGFANLAAFEINQLFSETLRANNPTLRVYGPPSHDIDVRNREQITAILSDNLSIKAPFEGVFHGGPPCQSFSIAANQRFTKSGRNFKRVGYNHKDFGTLLFDYIWQVKVFRPRVFIIENVVGLMTVDDGQQWSTALESLATIGYQLASPVLINAKFYGIPQSRVRLFVFGWLPRNKSLRLPPENLYEVPTYKALAKPVHNVPNHIIRDHKAESILRYMELNYGERDHLGRVDRLNPALPAKTIISGGSGGGGRSHLHPFIPRTLSPRESARLQTFPDDYIFLGHPARQFTQIGNAVPPLLALKLARSIYESIFA